MYRYNTLIAETYCPCCHEKITLKVQFHYGEVWDYIYNVNDELRWGNGCGEIPEAGLVVIDAVSEECEVCDESEDYLIFVENNTIKSYRQNYGEYQFFGTDGFIVLEDSIL